VSYYIADGSTQRGPFHVEQLRAQGVGPETLVWREGSPDWVPAKQVGELIQAGVVQGLGVPRGVGLTPPPPPVAPYPPPAGVPYAAAYHPSPAAPPNTSKIAAGICGILLGGFGVHKFILGYTGAGVIMLLVSVLTCFFASPVMHVIGIIEGILYLTKSDEEFHQTYVAQRREWF
jgi:TM2 domain-containing membrane protein YozV